MHAAVSVILLTTLIGVGQGLFLALYTGQVYSLVQLLPPQDEQVFFGIGSLLVLSFLVAGLVASFFHLGRPERAWRSASRWRTSWLSREVVALPAMMFFVLLYGGAHYLGWNKTLFTLFGKLPVDLTLIAGALGTLAAFVLYVCTGMIYAGIKFLQEWHSPFTVPNYILMGGASGFTLAAAFSAFVGADLVNFYGVWAVIITILAFFSRGASLVRNARLQPKSSLSTAIGIRHTQLAQKAQGSMGGSFNTREFFHGRSPRFLRWMRMAFLLLVFPVPVTLLAVAYWLGSNTLPSAAFAVQYFGLLAERWYFFAEARHPQNLYYQTVS